MVERIPVAGSGQGTVCDGFLAGESELLPVPGVTFVGELPDNLQHITRFAGADHQRRAPRRKARRC